MRLFFNVLILGLSLWLTSCATIFSGTSQRISIDSYPQGAEIIIDGQNEGKTPANVNMDRELDDFLDGGKEIQLELEGYKKTGYEIKTNVNPVAIINLFNLLFWAIDAATGAITKYERYNNFQLIPLEEKVAEPESEDLDDKYDKLTKLKKLLDEGIITQEEYDKEKAKILGN